MPMLVRANETVAARRRVGFHLVAPDGITPAAGEAGGQPQIADLTAGAIGWTGIGIGVLVAVGNGRYYAELTQAAVANAGSLIETRYKSVSTAECPGTSVQVVGFDPSSAFDTNLAAVKAKTDTIGAGRITTVSPVAASGDLTLVAGDSYTAARGRALNWVDAGGTWPDLTGAAITFETDDGDLIVAGTAPVPSGAGKTARVELTGANTTTLGVGTFDFRVVATYNLTERVTLVAGVCEVVDREDQ